MHCVAVKYPRSWPDCNVYTLADLHIGDPHHLRQEALEQIDRIREDPRGLAVLNGDLLNTAVRNSASDVYGETLSPIAAVTELTELLMPIKDRVIGAVCGNHEWRIYRNDGIDIMRLVCRELGIEDRYNPEGVLIFLRFGECAPHGRHMQVNPERLFTIYATHGSGGGRKEGAKAIRLADMASVIDADIFIHSHTHLPMIMREAAYRVFLQQSTALKHDRLFINTAAMLDYGGYGQMQEFKPASNRTPVIHLNAKKGIATATL